MKIVVTVQPDLLSPKICVEVKCTDGVGYVDRSILQRYNIDLSTDLDIDRSGLDTVLNLVYACRDLRKPKEILDLWAGHVDLIDSIAKCIQKSLSFYVMVCREAFVGDIDICADLETVFKQMCIAYQCQHTPTPVDKFPIVSLTLESSVWELRCKDRNVYANFGFATC